jgi:ubiquitin C-terminal hydrolase
MMVMLSVSSYSADEKPKADTAVSSKVYVVYIEQGKSYVLEGVEGVDFKGVKCLKGRHADITWAKGKICYVPVDKVSVIMEFDSLEQYKEDIQKFRDQQLK